MSGGAAGVDVDGVLSGDAAVAAADVAADVVADVVADAVADAVADVVADVDTAEELALSESIAYTALLHRVKVCATPIICAINFSFEITPPISSIALRYHSRRLVLP